MRLTGVVAGAFGALLVAGCAGLHSSQEATQVYTLEAAPPAPPIRPRLPTSRSPRA